MALPDTTMAEQNAVLVYCFFAGADAALQQPELLRRR